MTAPELGPWTPLSVDAAGDLFAAAPFRWWFSGGRALELHVGRSWRDHDDIDIGIIRRDAPALRDVLTGWDVQIAAGGRLSPWRGEPLDAARHQNNLWCRRRREDPWVLDITVGDGDDESWIYRRNPAVRLAWVDAVLDSSTGLPYLSPDLQLLFKSTAPRAKDDVDAREMVPDLDAERRHRLAVLLPADHQWQQLLAGSD